MLMVNQAVVQKGFGTMHETGEESFRLGQSVNNSHIHLRNKIHKCWKIRVCSRQISLKSWQLADPCIKVTHCKTTQALLP